jgi:hypothetical protein
MLDRQEFEQKNFFKPKGICPSFFSPGKERGKEKQA